MNIGGTKRLAMPAPSLRPQERAASLQLAGRGQESRDVKRTPHHARLATPLSVSNRQRAGAFRGTNRECSSVESLPAGEGWGEGERPIIHEAHLHTELVRGFGSLAWTTLFITPLCTQKIAGALWLSYPAACRPQILRPPRASAAPLFCWLRHCSSWRCAPRRPALPPASKWAR